jgi:hypothetical protein
MRAEPPDKASVSPRQYSRNNEKSDRPKEGRQCARDIAKERAARDKGMC